jgi:hypothetical protein
MAEEELYTFDDSDDEEQELVISPKIQEKKFNPPPVIQKPKLLPKTPVMRFDEPEIEQPKERKPETPVHISQADDDDIKMPTPVQSDRHIRTHNFRSPASPVSATAVSPEVRDKAWSLISDPLFSDFRKESTQIQDVCSEFLRNKFNSLAAAYPDRGISYPENLSLGKIHRSYHETLKSIHVSMNLSSYRLGYILCILAIEFVCVKVLGLPMSGFTKMEWQRIKKYDQLMMEIGETMYSYGTTQWPLHYRMAFSFAMNIVIFIGLKFAIDKIGFGGEKGMNIGRAMIDKIMDNSVSREDVETGKATGDTLGDGYLSEGNIGALLGKFTEGIETKKESKPKQKKRMIYED